MDRYEVTKDDCTLVINELIKIFEKTGLDKNVSLLVYGSYFDSWRKGLSDIDAILYFNNEIPFYCLNKEVDLFQKEINVLYDKLPFTRECHFFEDIFIIDKFHALDGRFLFHDKEKIEGFKKQADARLVYGREFLNEFNPVELRNEQEQELAWGLCRLRYYLFFEIPKPTSDCDFNHFKHMLKFLKILPRRISLINGGPMDKTLNVFKHYEYLWNINYSPYIELWEETSSLSRLEEYFKKCHEKESATFRDCLKCFEQTLEAVVQNCTMLSDRYPKIRTQY